MNKYQKEVLKKGHFYYTYVNSGEIEINVLDNDIIDIKQNENINIVNYKLCIDNNAVEKVYAIKNKKENEIALSNDRFVLDIDFNNRIDAIKLIFKENIVDDLLLKIQYIEADKEKYYAKVEQEKQEERKRQLEENAKIGSATGRDLVNIYFQPCCEDYASTIIFLYHEKWDKERYLIGKYKVKDDFFFQSITGLAYGNYCYQLAQYDKNGNELFRTEQHLFDIENLVITKERPVNWQRR